MILARRGTLTAALVILFVSASASVGGAAADDSSPEPVKVGLPLAFAGLTIETQTHPANQVMSAAIYGTHRVSFGLPSFGVGSLSVNNVPPIVTPRADGCEWGPPDSECGTAIEGFVIPFGTCFVAVATTVSTFGEDTHEREVCAPS